MLYSRNSRLPQAVIAVPRFAILSILSCLYLLLIDSAVAQTFSLSTNVIPGSNAGKISAEIVPGTGSEVSPFVYESGTKVKLTVQANEGFQFSDWSDSSDGAKGTGTNNPLVITMDSNKSLTAQFTTAPPSSIAMTQQWLSEVANGGPRGPYYLDQQGKTYILHSDVDASGTAFVLINHDISLDLNGYTVIYDNAAKIAIGDADFEGALGRSSTSWDFGNSSPTNVEVAQGTFVQPVSVFSGNQALRIAVPASDQFITSSQSVTLLPNTTYVLSAMVYNRVDSAITLYVELDGTAIRASDTDTSSAGFKHVSFQFKTGSAAETYSIKAGILGASSVASGHVYIDDIRIHRHGQHGVLVGPKGFSDIYHPDISRKGYALAARVKNGVISQGVDQGNNSSGIYSRSGAHDPVYTNLEISVSGPNSKAIETGEINNLSVNNTTLTSTVKTITSRHAMHAILDIDKSSGGAIHHNLVTGGPQMGMNLRGDIASGGERLRVHHNVVNLTSRYTNGYGIHLRDDTGTHIYDNIINAGNLDANNPYSGHGIGTYANTNLNKKCDGAEIYRNTVTVRALPLNQEYDKYGGYEYDGSFGIQLKGGSHNIKIYENSITAYAAGGRARAFRMRGEFINTNIHVYNNTFEAVQTGSLEAAVLRLRGIETANSRMVFENNTLKTNSMWLIASEVAQQEFRSNIFEVTSSGGNAMVPFRAFDYDLDPAKAVIDVKFIDNSYSNAEAANSFLNSSIVNVIDKVDSLSSLLQAYTTTVIVKDRSGNPLEAAAIEFTRVGESTAVANGQTDAQGNFSAVLDHFRKIGGINTLFNPYSVSVSKVGFQTKEFDITVDKVQALSVTLEPLAGDNIAPAQPTDLKLKQ